MKYRCDNDITKEEPKTGKHRTVAQQKELRVLLKKNSDLFSNSPGRTTLDEHHIEMGNAYPVKLTPYRVLMHTKIAWKRS